jgi:nucleotide-binding universal stress UspA family protein
MDDRFTVSLKIHLYRKLTSMKKILVPTDFSAPAAQALQFAVSVAQASGGSVHLMHVVDLPILQDSFLTPTAYVDDSIVKNSVAKAQKAFDKAIEKFKGAKITTSVEYGNPTMAILKVVEVLKADLVVMGTSGASGLKEIFVGSNTEKIVRGTKVPVISIPLGSKVTTIKNIVFPNSLQEGNEELTMAVKALANFFKAKLHLVYVNTPALFKRDHETIGRLRTYARRYMLKNFEIHVYNDISEQEGTMNFATEIGADMIAMGTHGRRGLAHMFTGSVAEDVVNHVKCPIWTLRSK